MTVHLEIAKCNFNFVFNLICEDREKIACDNIDKGNRYSELKGLRDRYTNVDVEILYTELVHLE